MSVQIKALRNPFSIERDEFEIDHGQSVREIVDGIDGKSPYTRVLINDEVIRESDYDRVPKDGDIVVVRFTPQGGGDAQSKGVWGMIGGALLAVTGAILVLTGVGAAIGVGLIGMGASMMFTGAGLYWGWFVPDIPDMAMSRPERLPMVRGSRNQARAWGTMPIVIGRHYVVPDLAAAPYTEIVGNDQYLRQLFVVGQAGVEVSELRIGETLLTSFIGVEYEILPAGAPSTLYPGVVNEEQVGIELKQDVWHERTTTADTDEIIVDFALPAGLVRFNDDGDKKNLGCFWAIQYRETGSGAWLDFTDSSSVGLRARQLRSIRRSYRRVVPRGQYDVRVQRLTADHDEDSTRISNLQWLGLKSVNDDAPINEFVLNNSVRVGLRIKATDQLQGVVDQFNCIAESRFPVYSGSGSGPSSWTSTSITRNPAAAMLWVLRGPLNGEPQPDESMDWPAFEAWYEFCQAEGFHVDGYMNSSSPISRVMGTIAAAGRGSPGEIDGLITVLIEEPRTQYVQHFSPRNSSNFVSQKNFRRIPHALKIGFVNEEVGYQQDERIVYNDGFDESTATVFEQFDLAWVTEPDNVWRFGRYRLAEAKLRPEMFTIDTDWENIVCTRGDLVKFSHDIMLIGITAGRIKDVIEDGGDITGVVVDESCVMEAEKDYVLAIRNPDEQAVYPIVTATGAQTTLMLVTPITSGGPIEKGDLFTFGEAGTETIDALVVGVNMMADLSAKIALVEHAPAIYDADTGIIPSHDPNITPPADRPIIPSEPVIISLRSDGTVLLPRSDGSFMNRILLSIAYRDTRWVGVDHYEVEWRLAPITDESEDELNLPVDTFDLEEVAEWDRSTMDGDTTEFFITEVEDLEIYDVRIRSVSAMGFKSQWATGQVQAFGKFAPPQNVSQLTATVRVGGIDVSWSGVADKDLSRYELREGASWESSDLLFEGLANHYLWDMQAAGVYNLMIRAVDNSGNKSVGVTDLTVTIAAPGVVGNLLAQAIDNTVIIGWTAPSAGTLPIAEYEIRRGATFATADVIATLTARYFVIPEADTGTYTYWIVAVDVAGNVGTELNVNANITALPVTGSDAADPPTLTLQGLPEAIQGRISIQVDLVKSQGFHLQVSDDSSGPWFAPDVENTDPQDWKTGNEDEWAFWPTRFFVHQVTALPTDLDGDGQPYPVPLTLWYRVRALNESGVPSDWSAPVSAAVQPADGANIALNSIAVNRLTVGLLQVLVAQVTDRIEVTADGLIGESEDGSRRIVISNDTMHLDRWDGSQWVTVQQIGGSIMGQFLPWFYGNGLVDKDADLGGVVFGTVRPSGLLTYDWADDFEDQNGADNWTKSGSPEFTALDEAPFGYRALRGDGTQDAHIQQTPAGMTMSGNWAMGAWLRGGEIATEEEAVFRIKGMAALAFTAYSLTLYGCPWDAPDVGDLPSDPPAVEIDRSATIVESLAPASTSFTLCQAITSDGAGTWIFTAGVTGNVRRSTDNGKTWSFHITPMGTTMQGMATDKAGTWVAVGNSGRLCRSTDNGVSWGSLISTPSSVVLRAVSTDGNGVWVAGGQSGHLFRSDDNGQTWGSLLTTPTTGTITDIKTDSSGTWVAIATGGDLFRSTDNGQTWGSLITTPTTQNLTSIDTDQNGVWVVLGATGHIFRSTNNGQTWGSLISYSTPGFLDGVATDGLGNWVVVGSDRTVIRSTNNAESWGSAVSPLPASHSTDGPRSVATDGKGTWVMVGSAGIVWRQNGIMDMVPLDAWTTDDTAPDEITITAAYPGRRPVPTSAQLTVETATVGAPERAMIRIEGGSTTNGLREQSIQVRLHPGKARLVAVRYGSTNDYVVAERNRNATGFSMAHVGKTGNELWFRVEGSETTLSASGLVTATAATARLDLPLLMYPRIGQAWLHPTVETDRQVIRDYRSASEPWGDASTADMRIQAAPGRDINYVTTDGGEHRFMGAVFGVGFECDVLGGAQNGASGTWISPKTGLIRVIVMGAGGGGGGCTNSGSPSGGDGGTSTFGDVSAVGGTGGRGIGTSSRTDGPAGQQFGWGPSGGQGGLHSGSNHRVSTNGNPGTVQIANISVTTGQEISWSTGSGGSEGAGGSWGRGGRGAGGVIYVLY